MLFFQQFYLDREKDIVVDLYLEGERLFHVIRTWPGCAGWRPRWTKTA